MIPVQKSTTLKHMIDHGFGQEESIEYITWLTKVYRELERSDTPYPEHYHPEGCRCHECEPQDEQRYPGDRHDGYCDCPGCVPDMDDDDLSPNVGKLYVGTIDDVDVFC